jgi:hypothetical protein
LTPKGYPVVQRITMSAPVTFPCPRIGMATNFVNSLSSVTSVSTDAEFMCFPRVIERPHAEEEDAEAGLLHPVDQVLELLDRRAGLLHGRPVHGPALEERDHGGDNLEVLAGPDLEEEVAARALGVSRMSTRTMYRPFRPWGTNLPFWVSVYFVKCRGWHSAGLPPQ